ncbi:hypothetical protein [Bradyrhizobium sp. JYMT SZCCT0180]|uniref:hypothetical protein n=1 Tax=Bradyrhizobium sp. JYMT SZCCT0180 TaxID=2807666 RepID=UPI001BA7BA8E|nr:hypothetical protein [Bradyrhizobium sp. JYMT SZCCT0180]MBR1214637.1 hypothetical protein [Bradyrhizobium sp. JYMT SZCCT0180]
MMPTREGILGFFAGLLFWLLVFALISKFIPAPQPALADIFSGIVTCVKDPFQCLANVRDNLTKDTAYGAVLGIIGLLIQLWWRGEWPTGQLNEGRPRVLVPSLLVTVTIAAIVAGISAAPLITGKMSAVGIVVFGYFVADAATLGVGKISTLVQKATAFIQSRIAAK